MSAKPTERGCEALAFTEVYDAAKGKPARLQARRCVAALKRAEPRVEDLLFLQRVVRTLAREHYGVTTGAIIVAVLKGASVQSIAPFVTTIAPRAWPLNESPLKTKARAVELHADCFLALDRWFREWVERERVAKG